MGEQLEGVMSFNERPSGTHLQINKLGLCLIAVTENIPWRTMRYLRKKEVERIYDSIWVCVGSPGESLRKQDVLYIGYCQQVGTVL